MTNSNPVPGRREDGPDDATLPGKAAGAHGPARWPDSSIRVLAT